ncbi:hypothetical protein, partial [Chryseobacterium koreense]|uniref:hypothetical protein n=1 Tax=Chryseobacterium koreense TaxID=232216 RepID=UPI0026EFB59B
SRNATPPRRGIGVSSFFGVGRKGLLGIFTGGCKSTLPKFGTLAKFYPDHYPCYQEYRST